MRTKSSGLAGPLGPEANFTGSHFQPPAHLSPGRSWARACVPDPLQGLLRPRVVRHCDLSKRHHLLQPALARLDLLCVGDLNGQGSARKV